MSVSRVAVVRAAGPGTAQAHVRWSGLLGGRLVRPGLVVCLVLTGCTGAPDRSATTRATMRATGVSPPAITHLSAITCKADANDSWSFTATVTNRDAVTQHYTIKASLVRKLDGHVAGSKEMTTELATGKSVTVSADRFFTGDPKILVCVPTVIKKPA